MGWHNRKRAIKKKPYLIDPYRAMSEKEAGRLWRASGYPGASALLERAYGLAADEKTKAALRARLAKERSPLGEKLLYAATFKRAAAAACLAFLLPAAFLAFTEPGRAFVQNAYRTLTGAAAAQTPRQGAEAPTGAPVGPAATAQPLSRHIYRVNDRRFGDIDMENLRAYLASGSYDLVLSDGEKNQLVVRLSWPDTLRIHSIAFRDGYWSVELKIGGCPGDTFSVGGVRVDSSQWNDVTYSFRIKDADRIPGREAAGVMPGSYLMVKA